jgi:hypothetical protein
MAQNHLSGNATREFRVDDPLSIQYELSIHAFACRRLS